MALIDSAMNNANLLRAQRAIMNVCSQGHVISFTKSATKDEFGSPLTDGETLDLLAHPIRFTPYDRKVAHKISWAEDTDILCYVAKLALDQLEISIEQLKRYKEFVCGGKTYNIRYVEPYSSFADDYLYVVIGGTKGTG